MSFERFISKRANAAGRQGFTKWILLIGTISVGIGVAVMIISASLIKGFQKEISEKVFGFWGHIHITEASLNSNFESRPVKMDGALVDTLMDIASIEYGRRNGQFVETKGGIKQVQGFALLPGILLKGDGMEGIIAKGVDDQYDWGFIERFLEEGRRPEFGENPSNDVLISRQTANRMELEMGDKIRVAFVLDGDQLQRSFKVCGIYKTGLEEYDKKFILVDIKKIRQLLKWEDDEIGAYEVIVENISDVDVLTEYIYYDVVDSDLYAESIKEKYPGIFEWLELQSVNERVILGLMLMVCILNMITAILILILERLQMIGTLKALGAKNWSIRKIFLLLGFHILLRGLVIGNVLGIGICLLQQKFGFIKLNEADYYLSTAPVYLDFGYILLLNLIVILVTMLCLIIPTYMITRISPVRAIRFN